MPRWYLGKLNALVTPGCVNLMEILDLFVESFLIIERNASIHTVGPVRNRTAERDKHRPCRDPVWKNYQNSDNCRVPNERGKEGYD